MWYTGHMYKNILIENLLPMGITITLMPHVWKYFNVKIYHTEINWQWNTDIVLVIILKLFECVVLLRTHLINYVLITCDYLKLFECIKLPPTSKRTIFDVCTNYLKLF